MRRRVRYPKGPANDAHDWHWSVVLQYAEMLNENLSLFAAEEWDLKRQLAAMLRELARVQLYVGTSSWKYQGWLGTVYQSERYPSRGRFSKAQFERDCLKEHAEVFHTVSGDFASINSQVPSCGAACSLRCQADFSLCSKRPRRSRLQFSPTMPAGGTRAAQSKPFFLDPRALITQFLALLEPYKTAIATIIFEFPASVAGVFKNHTCLHDALGQFFEKLPNGFRYAVEVRIGACYVWTTFARYAIAV